MTEAASTTADSELDNAVWSERLGAGSVWVIVPALNESENLRELVPRIHSVISRWDGARLLVVDDGSTDSTAATVDAVATELPGISLLRLGRNFGKATALQRGFDEAVVAGAGYVVMMDADGQDDPCELPRLLDGIQSGADLVTGARVERNDRFIKRKTSKLYNKATAIISRAPGRDFNSGFKAMRVDVALDVSPMLYGELHRYLTVIAHWLGYRVSEVPVQHHARMHGSTKYGPARFWRGFVDLLTVRFLMSYENRPSHLFGGFGFLSLFLGGLVLAYLTVLRLFGERIGDRPLLIAGVLLVMVGLQLTLFGFLAELTVHARNLDRRRSSRAHH